MISSNERILKVYSMSHCFFCVEKCFWKFQSLPYNVALINNSKALVVCCKTSWLGQRFFFNFQNTWKLPLNTTTSWKLQTHYLACIEQLEMVPPVQYSVIIKRFFHFDRYKYTYLMFSFTDSFLMTCVSLGNSNSHVKVCVYGLECGGRGL